MMGDLSECRLHHTLRTLTLTLQNLQKRKVLFSLGRLAYLEVYYIFIYIIYYIYKYIIKIFYL